MAARKSKKSKKSGGKSTKSSGPIVDLTRPRDPKISLQMAKDHLAGKKVDLNASLMSKTACQEAWKAHTEDGKPYPNIYCPVSVELGKIQGAIFRTLGHVTESNPDGVKEGPFRCNHPDSVKRGKVLAECGIHDQVDAEGEIAQEAICAIGDRQYVVGTTGADGEAAPFLVDASRTGAFAANILVTKALSFESMTVAATGKPVTKTEFGTVVGRINNKPMLIPLGDGNEAALFPGEVIEWGHIVKNGKPLTPTQVRALKDHKGVKFQALPDGGWIGCDVNKASWSEEFKEYMGSKATTTGPWYSLTNTQSRRQLPAKPFCFSFRTCCVGQPIGTKPDPETDGEKVVFMALGRYSTEGLSQKSTKSKSKKDKTVDTPPADETTVTAPEDEGPITADQVDAVTSETELDDADPELDEAAMEAALADAETED